MRPPETTPQQPQRRGDKCKGCKHAVRSLASIFRDVQALPRAADVIVVGPSATAEEFDARLVAVVSGRLTRLHAEINGYCYACAFRLEMLSDSADVAEEGSHHA